MEPELPSAPLITPDPTKPKRRWRVKLPTSRRKKLLLFGGLGLLLVIIAIGLVLVFHHKPKPVVVHRQATHKVVTTRPLGQLTFYTVPIKLGDLGFFKNTNAFGTTCTSDGQTNCPNSVNLSNFSYYRLGTTRDNQPIVEAYANQGEGDLAYVAIGTSSGGYQILAPLADDLYNALGSQTKDDSYVSQFRAGLAANVTLDTIDSISQLSFASSVTVAGLSINTGSDLPANYPDGYLLPDGLASIRGSYFTHGGATTSAPASTLLGHDASGKSYYEVTAEDQDNYSVREIYGTVNNVYAARYFVQDPLVSNDDSSKLATNWTSGDQTAAAYISRSQGCGSASGYVVAKGVDSNNLTAIGSGPNGQALYELPESSGLFKEVYGTDYAGGQYVDDPSLKNLTADQFQDQHGVFLAKNALGELVVYLRSDLIITGGCGKPVIYLYPTKTTSVSVKVGATVTKSAPKYPTNGWHDVIAQPNGQLSYQGQRYGSLFWEGLGFGNYPSITTGTVVHRDQAVSTITTQLQQQGLKANEIKDFLSFWQPKLPNTAYIRLSWLTAAQLNQLAPLTITPRPATELRVFLDFQGLNQPQAMAAPHFSAPKRTGFTVVEWGGLLHQNF